MKKALVCILMAVMAVAAFAQEKGAYVVMKDGSTKSAASVKMKDANGTLEVVFKKGSSPMGLPRNAYQYAYIPKPKELSGFTQAMENRNYDDVISLAPALVKKFALLGWGDYISGTEAEAQLRKGNVDAAKKALAAAKRTPGGNKDAVMRAEILILLNEKQYDKIDGILKQLMLSKDDDVAAFAFNMRGAVYKEQGQKKQAVLEYLKTLLLFEKNKKVDAERAEAKKEAVALLKELKDPRADKIAKMD